MEPEHLKFSLLLEEVIKGTGGLCPDTQIVTFLALFRNQQAQITVLTNHGVEGCLVHEGVSM